MTGKELVRWLDDEIELRQKVTQHSGCIAFDYDVSENILIYDVQTFVTIAKELGANITIDTEIERVTDVFGGAYFTRLGITVSAYFRKNEVKYFE